MVRGDVFDDDHGMKPLQHIDRCASDIRDSSWAFHEAVGREGSAAAALVAIAFLEEAFSALSAGWYEIRGDSARTKSDRHGDKWIAELDHIAAEFARCARKCREARLTLKALDTPDDGVPVAPEPKLVAL
jgi:hypothetical protein